MRKEVLQTGAPLGLHRLMIALLLLVACSSLAWAEDDFPPPDAEEELILLVNINTDDAETLAELLTGVGNSRAEAIVQYREEHGPFEQIDELTNVVGIGPATLDANRQVIVVE